MDNPSLLNLSATPFALDSHNGPSPHHDGGDRGPATGLHLDQEMKRNESSARFRQTDANANGTGSGIKALAVAGRHLARADVFDDVADAASARVEGAARTSQDVPRHHAFAIRTSRSSERPERQDGNNRWVMEYQPDNEIAGNVGRRVFQIRHKHDMNTTTITIANLALFAADFFTFIKGFTGYFPMSKLKPPRAEQVQKNGGAMYPVLRVQAALVPRSAAANQASECETNMKLAVEKLQKSGILRVQGADDIVSKGAGISQAEEFCEVIIAVTPLFACASGAAAAAGKNTARIAGSTARPDAAKFQSAARTIDGSVRLGGANVIQTASSDVGFIRGLFNKVFLAAGHLRWRCRRTGNASIRDGDASTRASLKDLPRSAPYDLDGVILSEPCSSVHRAQDSHGIS